MRPLDEHNTHGGQVRNKAVYPSILEMEGFNLTVMTCMGLGDITKKTCFMTDCDSLSG